MKNIQNNSRSNKVEQAKKLRIVTRTDLSQGQKIVQVAHVAAEFAINYPTQYKEWFENRSIITFEVRNGYELLALEKHLNLKGVETYRFYEPDYDEVTGIGLVPSDLARKHTSSLKLSGKSEPQEFYTDQIKFSMLNTEQMENLNVLQHGQMVHEWYLKIVDAMRTKKFPFYKTPKWLMENVDYLLSKIAEYDPLLIKEYQVMHDCGKPYVIEYDDQGKKHFPNHAKMSHDVWLKASGNEFTSGLMLRDMDMHTMKASDVDEFIKYEHFVILMLTSLAEIYANSTMFGGMDSVSFKMKFKQIEKRGNAIFRSL